MLTGSIIESYGGDIALTAGGEFKKLNSTSIDSEIGTIQLMLVYSIWAVRLLQLVPVRALSV